MTAAANDAGLDRWRAVAAWTALVAFETLAQVALKAGANELADQSVGVGWLTSAIGNAWVLTGIVGYIGSFAAWMVILERIPLSFGFPLTAIVMLTVPLASVLFFGDVLTPWRAVGIGLILAGVVIMGRGDT